MNALPGLNGVMKPSYCQFMLYGKDLGLEPEKMNKLLISAISSSV